MKIEIDTKEEIDKQDAKLLADYFGFYEAQDYDSLSVECRKLKEKLSSMEPDTTVKKLHPISIPNILLYLLDKHESLTTQEILERAELNEGSMGAALAKLKNDKIIGTSTTRPVRYFLRKKGDPELKEALKNVGKFKHMG